MHRTHNRKEAHLTEDLNSLRYVDFEVFIAVEKQAREEHDNTGPQWEDLETEGWTEAELINYHRRRMTEQEKLAAMRLGG